MAFHEVRFPEGISTNAVGGPGFKTTVVTTASGGENRNIEWSASKAEYDVAHAIKTQSEYEAILAFFNARRGRAYGFRFKDWSDYKSCSASKNVNVSPLDQTIGVGNGVTASFQLVKTYPDTLTPYVRSIRKPVSGTIRVAVSSVEKTLGTHFTVDTTTGVVTFTGGNIPGVGATVTAGYEFDVPVRFDTDKMPAQLEDYGVLSWKSIILVELRV